MNVKQSQTFCRRIYRRERHDICPLKGKRHQFFRTSNSFVRTRLHAHRADKATEERKETTCRTVLVTCGLLSDEVQRNVYLAVIGKFFLYIKRR